LIKELIPRTSYEKESFIKGFVLFFLTMELLLGTVSYLLFRIELLNLKGRIFLEMKNYSYTFEGEKFSIELVTVDKKEAKFYELLEDSQGLSILVPIPGSKKDALKVYYPREKLSRDVNKIITRTLLVFSGLSVCALFLSLLFSIYSINPLRKALHMIEEVTKDILHDLNTPLMTLKVNLKILKSKYKDEEIERSELALKQLEALREHLSPLHSEVQQKLEDVNLNSIVRQELENLKKLYPHLKVISNLRGSRIKGDEVSIRRIVTNLLENAFKHNLEKGWVEVHLKGKTLVIKNPSREIKNTKKLFERHYRESQRGLGLGLSIVKKLCSELGCEIQLEFNGKIFIAKVTFK